METKTLPDGRKLCIITRDELELKMSFMDKTCLSDDLFWFSALRYLTKEEFVQSSSTLRLGETVYDPTLLYATFKYFYESKSNIVDTIGDFFDREEVALEWWKAIPDSACSDRKQECGAAKIFDFYCRGVSDAVNVSADPVTVLVAGSSGMEKSGVAVYALAQVLDVLAPNSVIDAYDPHELNSEFYVGSTKVNRVRDAYPLGEWRDYDVVLDDTYVTHITTESVWEPTYRQLSRRASYACKSLIGQPQAYYSKNERRYYSRPYIGEISRYCEGMDLCENCRIVAETCGSLPCAPDFLFGLYVMCGVEPCRPLVGQKNMRAMGEVIQNVWCGNSMDLRHFPPDVGVEPYVRAAHRLKESGLVEFRNEIIYSRGRAYVAPREVKVNRKNVIVTNIPRVLADPKINWSKYAPFAPTRQYAPSSADVLVSPSGVPSDVPLQFVPSHLPGPPGKVKLIESEYVMGGKTMIAYYRPASVKSNVRGRKSDVALSREIWLKYGVSAYCRTAVIDWSAIELSRPRAKSCPARVAWRVNRVRREKGETFGD